MQIKQWTCPEHDSDLIDNLIQATGYPELVCRILAARGLRDHEAIQAFLQAEPVLEDPLVLADMDLAAARVRDAIEEGERICVFGDYDCDGVTAVALLTSYLQAEGADVLYYIPEREGEGYGLNRPALDLLADHGVQLVITVDNGVSAHEEIRYAATLGMDVVVTDHHTPRDTLPEAVAVVNPHRADCPSRCKELAGVGVAYKLVCALEGAACEELLEFYGELVAVGTIADIVPLVGENRVMVRYGLEHLSDCQTPGLAALLETGGLRGQTLTSEQVAFGLVPRINAVGRIDSADEIVQLLLTDDADIAAELAGTADALNVQRKEVEAAIMVEIEDMLAKNPHILQERLLIVSGRGWHHGVVGIVASRLARRYGKPSIVFSIDGAETRGSGRSLRGFSLIEAITACAEYATQYGGHTLAAGLTVSTNRLPAMTAALQAYAKEHHPVMPLPELVADVSLSPRELTVENIESLRCLEPFGAENEAPLFHLGGLRIEGIYPTSNNKHIRLRFSGGGNSFYAVYFGVSPDAFPYNTGDSVEIMAKISADEYNGSMRLSVKIADLRPPDVPQDAVRLGWERYAGFLRGEPQPAAVEAEMCPTRDDIALVYRYLRHAVTYPYGADALYLRLLPAGIDYGRMLLALDVLEEMGFVRKQSTAAGICYTIVKDAPKADLADSQILLRLQGEQAAIR